jgi:hypothetical protein
VRGDEFTYAGCGKEVLVWKRLECQGLIGKHTGELVALTCVGDVLVSMFANISLYNTVHCSILTHGIIL